MASFDKGTPVLRFHLPRVADWVAHKWLFWPVLGWRVVAPRSRQRTLNILQKAVLGLCRSGRPTAEQIAARMHLGQDLAAFIVIELQQLGWLDGRGTVTKAGLKVLEAEQSEPTEQQTVGWVFSDPFNGAVWPRFASGELPFAETEPNEEGYPRMVGSKGDGTKLDAHAVLPRPNEVVMRTPTTVDVVRACRAHRRQYGWESELEADDAPAVHRVSFVSNDATPFLVAVRAWRDKAAEWHVDDPFGIGESLRLRRQIEDSFEKSPNLRRWLGNVVGGDVADDDIANLQSRARWDVETRLTAAVHRWPAVEERLVAMQRALLEVEAPGSPLDKWDDVAVKAQKASERVLLELTSRWAPRTRLTQTDYATNEMVLARLARDAGFRAPLPESLIKVRTGKIHAARTGNGGGLRPLALLALLGTPGCTEHPYFRAARAAPDLLHRIDALAKARDEAGHEFTRARRGAPERKAFEDAIAAGVHTAFDLAHHLLIH